MERKVVFIIAVAITCWLIYVSIGMVDNWDRRINNAKDDYHALKR